MPSQNRHGIHSSIRSDTQARSVPTVLEVEKRHALYEEIRELSYRKLTPFLFIGTAVITDKLMLNFNEISALGKNKSMGLFTNNDAIIRSSIARDCR